MSEAPVEIRKYGNRRLYSSAEARFITLGEVSALVKNGQKVRVTDAAGNDITCDILTQILLEDGRVRHFPVALLEQMIRLNEETLKAYWQNYLNQSLQMFLGMQKEMEKLYQRVSQKTIESINPLLTLKNGVVRRKKTQSSEMAQGE